MSNMGSSHVAPLERSWPVTSAEDELRLQWEFLTFLRVTAVNKVAGLSPELASAAPLASSPFMSALGVIKHLTAVERWWASIVGGGKDLPPLWDDDDVNAEFRLTDEDTPVAVVQAYRAEWSRSQEALAGMTASQRSHREVGGKPKTVRWLLAHLVQETARHVGHLDILRELADGQVGE